MTFNLIFVLIFIKTYILSLTHNKDLSSWLSSSLSDRCRDLIKVQFADLISFRFRAFFWFVQIINQNPKTAQKERKETKKKKYLQISMKQKIEISFIIIARRGWFSNDVINYSKNWLSDELSALMGP